MSYREQEKASDKGLIAEVSFELEALKQGLLISKPIHPKSVYDYIIDCNGLKRIQVKFTSCKTPAGRFSITCAKGSTSKYSKRSQYYADEIDYIAGLTSDGDWYIIPMSLAPKTMITLTEKYNCYKNNWEFK